MPSREGLETSSGFRCIIRNPMKLSALAFLLAAGLAFAAEPAKETPATPEPKPFFDPAAPAPTVDPTQPVPEPSLPTPEKKKPDVTEKKKKKEKK
jgi:outer membrane biosynthesis protein TonB